MSDEWDTIITARIATRNRETSTIWGRKTEHFCKSLTAGRSAAECTEQIAIITAVRGFSCERAQSFLCTILSATDIRKSTELWRNFVRTISSATDIRKSTELRWSSLRTIYRIIKCEDLHNSDGSVWTRFKVDDWRKKVHRAPTELCEQGFRQETDTRITTELWWSLWYTVSGRRST